MEEQKDNKGYTDRSFPYGEGDGGWGRMNSGKNVQECDAMEDDKNY